MTGKNQWKVSGGFGERMPQRGAGSAGPVAVNMRAFGANDTTSGFSGAVGWEAILGRCRELRLPGGEHADGPGRCPDLAQGFLFAGDRAERIHLTAIFEPRGHVSR